MNELKFRAWDEDAGCFAYSDQETDYYVWGFEDGKLKAWTINETCGTIDEPPDHECIEIEEPEQFTGLKDKNGKEIYEGDTLKHPYKGIRSVYWEEEEGGFAVNGTYLNRMADGGEIIGNVHENPELSEGK